VTARRIVTAPFRAGWAIVKIVAAWLGIVAATFVIAIVSPIIALCILLPIVPIFAAAIVLIWLILRVNGATVGPFLH
jgi:hypothetical protein